MNNTTKKILYILLGLLVVGIAVFFIFFYKATININVNPNSAQIELAGNNQMGSLNTKLVPGNYYLRITMPGYVTYEKNLTLGINQKINLNIDLKNQPDAQKVTDFPGKYSTLTEDKSSLLYIASSNNTGYIINNINSNKTAPSAITPAVFGGINNLYWAPSKLLAILANDNGEKTLYDFGRYDLLNQEEKKLGTGIGDLSFTKDGNKIIYFNAPGTGEKSLVRANKDNGDIERLIDLRNYNINNPKLRLSTDEKYVMLITDQIFLIDMYLKTVTQLTQFSSISDATFTPDSQAIIYERDNSLTKINFAGNEERSLNINTTLKKTTWNDNYLIYATREANSQSDTLAQKNLNDDTTITYTYNTQNQNLNMTNLYLNKSKSKIFFESNGYIYSLDLVENSY